jgi:hypothetical protein
MFILIFSKVCITNLRDHDLAIIVVWNLLFIGSYKINTNVIHLFVLFAHQCHAHCLDMNVICLFILFKHGCCMSICVVYTQKLWTQSPCLTPLKKKKTKLESKSTFAKIKNQNWRYPWQHMPTKAKW